MTAYELADELQKLDAKLHLIDLFKSAVMLRQQADRIAELEQKLSAYIVELELHKAMIQDLEKQNYRESHEGFSTIEEVIAKHEAIPSRKEAIDKAREWLKAFDKPQTEPVAWWTGKYEDEGEDFMFPNTRQAHIDHPESATHEFFPIPLYTTPQTKPLSDEKIEKILYSVDWAYDPVLLVKAIEKEHGIV